MTKEEFKKIKNISELEFHTIFNSIYPTVLDILVDENITIRIFEENGTLDVELVNTNIIIPGVPTIYSMEFAEYNQDSSRTAMHIKVEPEELLNKINSYLKYTTDEILDQMDQECNEIYTYQILNK
jgi:hypothetical protein